MTLEEYITRWEQVLIKGRRENRIKGMRSMLLGQLRQRFGRVPAGTRRAVEAIQSERELLRLARQVLVASSLAELGLR
jgi:hypothetical protein